jgi:release factor H-coupled RctB family protein
MDNFISQRGPRVRVVASQTTWIEGDSLRQLNDTAALPGMQLAVGYPDLGPGKGSPVGAAFQSTGILYPNLVGSDIGCGMGLWTTSLPKRRAKPERIVDRLNGIDLPWQGDTTEWLAARGLQPTPYDVSLGTPGRSNHFIEVMSTVEVHDSTLYAALGMDQGNLLVLVHSGSRGLGEAVLRSHTNRRGSGGLNEGSDEAGDYMAAHDNAVLWAKANRALCANRVIEALETEASLVLDVCHNSVTQAVIGGCQCWLHRKGAAPSDRGAVVIPGSRGDSSYLVQPSPGREDVLLSIAHGAGRKIPRGEAYGKLNRLYRREDLAANPWGGRVVCGEEQLLWEEAPECYKDISSVIGDLEDAGLLSVIAVLQPMVTFKSSEGAREERRATRKSWKQDRQEARDVKRLGGFW